jgi:hypothetical protein
VGMAISNRPVLPTINCESVVRPQKCALLNGQGRSCPGTIGELPNWRSFVCDLLFAIFVHLRFAEPDGPEFEDAIVKLRKRPEQALLDPSGVCFTKMQTFVNGDNE